MFPLIEKKITGFKFGDKTFYSDFHLGTDYGKTGQEIYAPFDGKAVKVYGAEGGNTILFYPLGKPELIRFLHLKQYRKIGNLREGELMGIVGYTGKVNPPGFLGGHTHIDISKNGKLELWNRNNFIDPEKYNWETISPIVNIKTSLIFNKPLWPSLLNRMARLQDWFWQASGNRLWLNIQDPIKTPLFCWPYIIYPDVFWWKLIKPEWYTQYVMPFAKESKAIVFVVSNESWDGATNNGLEVQGYCDPYVKNPIRAVIAVNETEQTENGEDAFFEYARHELLHGLYNNGQPSGFDFTHKRLAEGQPEKCFDDLDFTLLKII